MKIIKPGKVETVRLTEKHYGENRGYYMKCSENCPNTSCDDCEKLNEIVDRLGEYEDMAGHTTPKQSDRDKLLDLLDNDLQWLSRETNTELANWLIAHGVTFRENE